MERLCSSVYQTEQLEAAFAQHRGIGDVNAGFIGGAANGFRHAVWIVVARVWS